MSNQVLRRVGVLGDVHGDSDVLTAALAFLQADATLDALICTGDLPAKQGIGDTERCRELLEAAGVLVIQGNHDFWALENEHTRVLLGLGDEWPLSRPTLDYLRVLPRIRKLETVVGPLLLCHGLDTDFMTGIYPGDDAQSIVSDLEVSGLVGHYRYVVAGHTHKRMVRPFPEIGLTWLNPGTLRRNEAPCVGVLDFGAQAGAFFDVDPVAGSVTLAEEFDL